MKSEKDKLLEKFDTLYSNRLLKQGWENRTRISKLMRKFAELMFDSILGNSSKLINPDDLANNAPWWVLKAKPNSGKTTVMIDVLIPVMTSISSERKIFPVWILVNPATKELNRQCFDLSQSMIDSTDEIRIKLHGTDGAASIKTLTKSIKRDHNFYKNASACIIVVNQPMINAGYDTKTNSAKGCKEYTRKLLETIVDNLKYCKKEYDVIIQGIHDECRVASCSTKEISKYSSKQSSFQTQISFMPAIIDFYNSVIPDTKFFNVIGLDGTPKYHMEGIAPKKKVGATLFADQEQNNEYSLTVDYGGSKDIWEVVELDEIPLSEDTLDESFYAGMIVKSIDNFYSMIDEGYLNITKINHKNSLFAKKYDEELKLYGIRTDNRKRIMLVPGGSNIDDSFNVRYERQENIAEYLRKKHHEHTVLSEDECYWMDSDGTHYHVGEMDEVENLLDVDGISQCLILKKKRMTGWNEPRCMIYVGTSEHTDMMPYYETAKNFEGVAQGVTRTVRSYSAFTDLDGNPLTPRQITKTIGELKKDKRLVIAEAVRDLVRANNQFQVFYVDSSGYDGKKKTMKSDVNGQLDAWLKKNYSNEDLFLEIFDEEILKYSPHSFSECTCNDCPIHGEPRKVEDNVKEFFTQKEVDGNCEDMLIN